MILEVAVFHVDPARDPEFHRAIQMASPYIAKARGYLGHTVHRCQETPGRYLLLVHWQTLADHLEGFRQSEDFLAWREILGPFFTRDPQVEHYDPVYPSP
ncbi:MAG: antibiotic biosynthesis monooxygenase family protein [Thermostichales cyanobacterium BF3_bins_165]